MSEPEDDINNNPQVHSKNNRRIDTRRVENRLIQLESRLEKAREARDQYLDFMKSKYPEWQPPKIITYRSRSSGPPRARPNYHNRPKFYEDDLHRGKNFYPRGYYEDHHPSPQRPPPVRSSLLGRLETSQYFWNNSTSQQARQPEPWRANFLAVNEPIPSSHVILDSDIPAMMSKLKEIKENLHNLRDYRLSMPSVDYFKSIHPALRVPNFNESSSQENPKSYYGDPRRADLPTLAEIRSRILNMNMNIEKRTREIISEQNRLRSMSAQAFLNNRNMATPYINQALQNFPSPYQQPSGQVFSSPYPNQPFYTNQLLPNQVFPESGNWPPHPAAPEFNYKNRLGSLQESMRNLQDQLFPQPQPVPPTNQFQNLNISDTPGTISGWMGQQQERTQTTPGWMPPQQTPMPTPVQQVPQTSPSQQIAPGKPNETIFAHHPPPHAQEAQKRTSENATKVEPSKDLEIKIPERRTISFGTTTNVPKQESTNKISAPTKTKEEPMVSTTKSEAPVESQSSYSKMLELLKPKTYVVSSSSDSEDEKVSAKTHQKPVSFLGSANLGGSTHKSNDKPASSLTLKPSTSNLLGSSLSSTKASPKKSEADSDSDFFG